MRRRVGEPCAVEEDAQLVSRAEVLDGPEFVERVAGAELGGLGDGDGARLREVLVAAARESRADQLWSDLPVRRGDREELRPEDPLRGAALVGVDVGRLGAD